ncbi:hypothetical protein [Streptomyces humi]|uniref:hypothetical protein n=1 Tax=Streptomyces humi TaxID=1428620 RepID=UPI00142DD7F4|nr:hypothetical protein [Streptomyces humi]
MAANSAREPSMRDRVRALPALATAALGSLVLAEGGTLGAPEGYGLTLTVS